VVLALHEIFPEAPLYTSIYDRDRMPEKFKKIDIRASFMKYLPRKLNKRHYFWLYPRAFESLNLSEYDLIISSSSAFAKGVKKAPNAKHICYCHTPMRFVWWYRNYIKYERVNPIIKMLLPLYLARLKKWDNEKAKTVDYFIANSKNVQKRVKEIYGRESDIIYPPVDTDLYHIGEGSGDYFLIVSRLLSYKRIDIAVDAFSKLGLSLIIVGEGPDMRRLKSLAGGRNNIQFLGWQKNDSAVAALYKECHALIQTGEEDLGLVPLEAAACGRPTIAYGAGGALETVINGETGILFDRQDSESLIQAIIKYEKSSFNQVRIRRHAENFSKNKFKEKVMRFLSEIKTL